MAAAARRLRSGDIDKERRAMPDDSTINFDGRHDNGAGRYTTATGGMTAARGSRATECTTTSTGGMMTTKGSRAIGGITTVTSGPDDSTIN